MNFDSDDFFLGSLGEEDGVRREALRDIERERARITAMPLMRKARSIYQLINALVGTFPERDDLASHYREIMLGDAGFIAARIAAAEGTSLYTMRMENAVQIKISARNIISQSAGLRMLGFCDESYVRLLREEMDEFRYLFVAWVSGFDRTTDIRDDWGLFY